MSKPTGPVVVYPTYTVHMRYVHSLACCANIVSVKNKEKEHMSWLGLSNGEQ